TDMAFQFQLPSTGQATHLACTLRRSVVDVGDSVVEFLGLLNRPGSGQDETLSPKEHRQLLAALRGVHRLQELDDTLLNQLANSMRVRLVQPSEYCFD
uniref:BBS2_C domain-containing protein n=1 Tax=Macrostomum lignano TaxID=282301 RepID=A0A1I8HUV3_9PLAT